MPGTETRRDPHSPLSSAAAQAVLMEAGGRVINTEFDPLTYNREESVLNPEFYALGDPAIEWEALLKS